MKLTDIVQRSFNLFSRKVEKDFILPSRLPVEISGHHFYKIKTAQTADLSALAIRAALAPTSDFNIWKCRCEAQLFTKKNSVRFMGNLRCPVQRVVEMELNIFSNRAPTLHEFEVEPVGDEPDDWQAEDTARWHKSVFVRQGNSEWERRILK